MILKYLAVLRLNCDKLLHYKMLLRLNIKKSILYTRAIKMELADQQYFKALLVIKVFRDLFV